MDPILFRHRKRDLIADDIVQIRATITAQYARERSHTAHTLCEQWQWRQANGRYKEFAARDLLLRLEEAGLIALPPRQRAKVNRAKKTYLQIPLYARAADGNGGGFSRAGDRAGAGRARRAVGLPARSLPLRGPAHAGR